MTATPTFKGAPSRARLALPVLFGFLLSALAGCERRPATWEYISPILFEPNCATASCHSRASAVSGLDFSDSGRGYRSLTGLSAMVDTKGPSLRPFVTPYQPQQSRLVELLRARNAPRMPPDRPFPEADIRLVEEWILNGAREHTNDEPRVGADARTDAPQLLDGGPDVKAGTDGGNDAAMDAATRQEQ